MHHFVCRPSGGPEARGPVIAASVFLLVAEFVAACVTAALYGTAGDPTWLGLTLLFALVASLAVQLALVVIHRDIGRDRPLVLLLHLLQMGALVRCVPMHSLIVWHILEVDVCMMMELVQIFTQNKMYAFSFLLLLLGVLMSFSLLATAYGAVVLTFLAIRLEHPLLELGAAPAAYVLALVWRSLEMAARVSALVLFAASCRAWCFLVICANLAIFAALPWIGAVWRFCSAPIFTAVALFCWPATRFRPDSPDFVARKHSWVGAALYYGLRFAENSALVGGWLVCRGAAPLSSGGLLCGPAVAAQIGAAFGLSLILMLVFYQFAHPARRLMRRNVADLCPPTVWCQGGGARAVDTAGVGEAV
uniref:XK-related protein n=1 Tax=Eptatretus burgeri TaxID=7764 RepID=A0A8C4R4W6_EPTBU